MEAPPVQYADTPDGIRLAYAVAGEGPPVINLPFHYNHVLLRWHGPSWFRGVAEQYHVVHYDSRGQGLSTRNLSSEITIADYRSDLETIVEASGLDRFALMAYGGFGMVAMRYAAEHPERVTALVLICSSESFTAWSQSAHLGMAEENWDLFLELQTRKFKPEVAKLVIEFFKGTTSQHDYLRMVRAFIRDPSVSDLVPKLKLPTLLLHSLDQHWLPPAEGARLASRISGSRILFTDGDVEPDQNQAIPAINDFLKGVYSADPIAPQPRGIVTSNEPLTARQSEVLALIACGKTTREIAAERAQ